MSEIAVNRDFKVLNILMGPMAEWGTVKGEITKAVERLQDPDDMFFISFSGHGSESAASPHIQTWCLADREVEEWEILAELAHFKPTTRVLVVSASCHSGGLGSGPLERWLRMLRRAMHKILEVLSDPPQACELKRDSHEIGTNSGDPPSILLLASCQANETSQDGTPCSVFTRVLCDVWKDGAFKGTYRDFVNQISGFVAGEVSNQTPTCAWAGKFPDWYDRQGPFTINP